MGGESGVQRGLHGPLERGDTPCMRREAARGRTRVGQQLVQTFEEHVQAAYMNLILIAKHNGRPVTVDLGSPAGLAGILAAAALAAGLVFLAGAQYAGWRAGIDAASRTAAWQQEFARQRAEIADARAAAQDGVDALAVRLGRVHAHVIRLDALGQRLTQMAAIESGEFDFDREPALGGPEVPLGGEEVESLDFIVSLDQLSEQLERRERQLTVLENLLLNRNLQREVLPAGRPISSGWISSRYGVRNDPFSGQRAHHGGIDFAGRAESPIVAVASGVVTHSGDRFGYGMMVEINHGNGYVTRYAHNSENLVRVGDTVKKGQRIALMGATGRATAPHVHFEVLQNGRMVNPLQYISEAN